MSAQPITSQSGHYARVPADTVQNWDNEHFIHPWDSPGTSNATRPIAASAEGIHLYSPDGRWYIDRPGGMWAVQSG